MNERSTVRPKKFKCILADPPWDVYQKGGRGAIQHYPLMTLDAIKSMPISQLGEDDSHCWLWVTNATLRDGYDVLESWGYSPRSPLTWIKPRMGLGKFLRNMTEHLILGTRGRAPVNYRSQPTWTFAPVGVHSAKPHEQYAIIERVSSGPYLELFARRRQPGWAAWGNEMPDSDVVIPGYPVPSDALHSKNGREAR
ncbi:MT-A70 family methyltransferase [Nocardia salmonicida]|uniref:MT-A70 family methyltransferase n=1 Tax=Nocardia salmonicida TaxID=53431 RepID=UPI003409FB98